MPERKLFRFLLIILVVSVTCWFARNFQGEDALIFARYVRNALHGQGLVFNAGERVNALTSPLFTILLLVVSWLLHGHILLAEFVLCGGFFIGACMLVEELVPWSGVFVASTAYFYFCLGMETFQFLFLLTLMTLLYIRGRLNWLPLLAALTVLTRFEGLALVAVIACLLILEKKKVALWTFVPPLLLMAAYFYFNRTFYGKWFPSSATAKMQQGMSGLWGRWPTAFLHVAYMKDFFRPSIYVLPLGLLFALRGMVKEQGTRLTRVLIPFGFLLGCFYVFFNLPNYHWYYAPFIFFLAMYAVRGLPQTRLAQVCLALAICECFGSSLYLLKGRTAPQSYISMAYWLKQNTRQDAKIASIEIGTLAWYDDRYTDDILGLTNPVNALRVKQRDWTSWLVEQKPDYVVVHDLPNFGETGAVASSDYAALPEHFGHVYLLKRKDSNR